MSHIRNASELDAPLTLRFEARSCVLEIMLSIDVTIPPIKVTCGENGTPSFS
jgi:hypothetical protein